MDAAFSPYDRVEFPDDIRKAWLDACLAAFRRGEKPVVNFPIGGPIDSRVRALIDEMTGEEAPVTWLPADRFPSGLPAQYFNPDLILPEGT